MIVATLVDLENAMVAHFLANGVVAAKISKRFYKIACKEWILAREDFLAERSPRTGQWADYRRAGQLVTRLKGGRESQLKFAGFEIRTFGQVVEDAEALQELFIAVLGQGFDGVWGTVPIKNARWDYADATSDYDETIGQAYASIGLLVPYRSS